MKLRNVALLAKDWIKSGFDFGKGFSSYAADKLEMEAGTAKKATTAFDAIAGTALTIMGASSAIGATASAMTAVGLLLSAPVTAAVTIVLTPVWLCFAAMTAGVGLGMLDAARLKLGIGSSQDVPEKVRAMSVETTSALRNIINRGKKMSTDFAASVSAKPKAADPAPKAPTPTVKPPQP